jgi:methylenetetrahydrofolate reductase (NADPH)
MAERLPGVRVPPRFVEALVEAGDDAERTGTALTVEVIEGVRSLPGVAGVHLMGMGRDDLVRGVVEGAELFPRPAAA